MLKLNLVSPQKKKEIRLKHIFIMLKQIGNLLVVITAAIAAYILLGQIIIHNHFIKTLEQTTLINEDRGIYDNKVRGLNFRLNYILKIQKEYFPFSTIIEEVMKKVDDNITFSSIQINSSEQTITFKGRAATRESLLSLKDHLSDSDFFADVELPISSILQKENINFDFKTILTIYEDNKF